MRLNRKIHPKLKTVPWLTWSSKVERVKKKQIRKKSMLTHGFEPWIFSWIVGSLLVRRFTGLSHASCGSGNQNFLGTIFLVRIIGTTPLSSSRYSATSSSLLASAFNVEWYVLWLVQQKTTVTACDWTSTTCTLVGYPHAACLTIPEGILSIAAACIRAGPSPPPTIGLGCLYPPQAVTSMRK